MVYKKEVCWCLLLEPQRHLLQVGLRLNDGEKQRRQQDLVTVVDQTRDSSVHDTI